MSHVLPQFAHFVSKTEMKAEDEWSASDVRVFNKLIVNSSRDIQAGVPGGGCGCDYC